MDFRQLEMFVAVVEEGNFLKGAARVFRTQSAVSIALRKLEQEIGPPLFDRSDRHAYRLTDTGQQLYDYAKQLLHLRDEALCTLKEPSDLKHDWVRIGANESASRYLVPRIALVMRDQYPHLKLDIVRRSSAGLPLELRERWLDFAILSFQPEGTDLEAWPILHDEMVLIVSPQHGLARQERVRIRDLGAESFIGYNADSPSWNKVLDAFHRFQTRLNTSIEIASVEGIKRLVALNLGVGFVPRMCVHEEVLRGELVTVMVDGFHQQRTLWLARRRTETCSEAMQLFLRVVQSLANAWPCDQPWPRFIGSLYKDYSLDLDTAQSPP